MMKAEKENHLDMIKIRERDMQQLEGALQDLKTNFDRQNERLREERD